jgi:hypothetical protein
MTDPPGPQPRRRRRPRARVFVLWILLSPYVLFFTVYLVEGLAETGYERGGILGAICFVIFIPVVLFVANLFTWGKPEDNPTPKPVEKATVMAAEPTARRRWRVRDVFYWFCVFPAIAFVDIVTVGAAVRTYGNYPPLPAWTRFLGPAVGILVAAGIPVLFGLLPWVFKDESKREG